MGNLVWVVDPFPLVRLYVQMVRILLWLVRMSTCPCGREESLKSPRRRMLCQNCMGTPTEAAGNFSVLLVCLTTPTTHASCSPPYFSAVTQLRVFLTSSYNWLYPHPVMVLGVRSRKPLLLSSCSYILIPPQGLVVKFKKKLVVNNP